MRQVLSASLPEEIPMPLPAGKIDVHHHCLPEFYKDVQRAAGIGGTAYQGFPEWTPEKSLALMDKLNIAATVFSSRLVSWRCNSTIIWPD
jgi:hypothetical protein